mmetsp:Transcript_434/g.408  ORF Transcript_434/g.408 Transcript_434/m.408 type:complete len:168 (+) Transcript_434:1152-1655(+)
MGQDRAMSEVQHDQLYVAERLRNVFKRTKDAGISGAINGIIGLPLDMLRKMTIPCSDEESWDRERAAIHPLTSTWAFCFLMSMIGNEMMFLHDYDPEGLADVHKAEKPFYVTLFIMMLPGLIFAVYIKQSFTKTAAPNWFMILSSIFCFLVSISWINFTAGAIVDLL